MQNSTSCFSGIAEHRQRLADENDGKVVPIAVKIAPDLSDDGVKTRAGHHR